ncbi:hypothetical protein F2P81_014890 [Scophthalmus maximus]|uniref:Uncharacterized protein n=1 Tax=Scophthalmus maximus TaxID=52904 RepID=A0A6A4SL65_SCOMX|nr:hypothetical protein F2P81_014890 [Scophthalmus maximus]
MHSHLCSYFTWHTQRAAVSRLISGHRSLAVCSSFHSKAGQYLDSLRVVEENRIELFRFSNLRTGRENAGAEDVNMCGGRCILNILIDTIDNTSATARCIISSQITC